MAKAQKQELAVIDFTQFSVAQLPELQGKKEEIASIIEANPIVEIVDNATYESAKKSRTAVKTLRTSLEKEQKDVKKKIKEHVLDVVDSEYDILILGVKASEQSRQEPIDVWEAKKEEERKEKARLEQERIDGIKAIISQFKKVWEELINVLRFEGISVCRQNFNNMVAGCDRDSLAEFDVLFDREVSYLTDLLNSKIKTITEQEQIRIDNFLIQEKNAEQSRIQEWQRNWNANIDSLSFLDIADVKSILVKSKLADLKHYISGYEEIYLSTEKRLHSQIEFVSKAEEQRIAQEKFDQEKKEFEEKQAEAKFKERKNILFDEGYWEIFFRAEANENNEIAKSKLVAYSEDEFDKFLDAVKKARTPIDEVEVVSEEVIEIPTVDELVSLSKEMGGNHTELKIAGIKKADESDESANNDVQEVEFEETWDSIENDLSLKFDLKNEFVSISVVFEYLKENYNVPIKK